MPLFRVDKAIHYFAHIPKCAGSSVEKHILSKYGSIAFRDFNHHRNKRNLKNKGLSTWNITSPQHILWDDLKRLFPADWIDSTFTVVRNPVSRYVSCYKYQKYARKKLDSISIDQWFAKIQPQVEKQKRIVDNHLQPQHLFLPEETNVFKLEDGLSSVLQHLDALGGLSMDQHVTPHWLNRARGGGETSDDYPSPETISGLIELYRNDFLKFGYSTDLEEYCPNPNEVPS